MFPGLLVKLRPTTPWRIAPDSGARDRVESLLRSDSLHSAITLAMQQLGLLEDWLAATVRHPEGPAVRFSCCYPFAGDTLLAVPPRSLWPPAPTPRVRWKSARYVPVSVIEKLVNQPSARLRDEEGWVVDPESECLLPASPNGKQYGPFRANLRSFAAVDRITGVSGPAEQIACLEFAPHAGLWFLAVFASEEAEAQWAGPLGAALRLLADSGFGAGRSRGWGRAADPELQFGQFPDLLMRTPEIIPSAPLEVDPALTEPSGEPVGDNGEESPSAAPVSATVETAYWLLSLFSPGEHDTVDWTRGAYRLIDREGRTGGAVAPGRLKKALRMVAEGSVLLAQTPLRGAAPDVAPDQHPHPVYRSGFALALPIAWRVVA